MPLYGRLSALGALVCAAAAFIIVPVAMSAFMADDQFNSTVNGYLSEHHESLASLAWRTTLGFFVETARFLPGFYLQAYGVFHLAPSLAAYKTVQIVLLSLDFVLLAVFLRTIRFDAGAIALAALCVLTSVQFHGQFDGFLGFSGTNEFLLLLAFGSWILFALFLRYEKLWLWAASIAVFVIGVLNYEMCYPLSFVHVLIAVQARGRAGWRAGLPFLLITVAAFGQLAFARVIHPQHETSVYAVHVTSTDYVRTLFFQVTASLPLAFLAFHRATILPPGTAFWSASPPWVLAALALTAASAAFLALRSVALRPRALAIPAAIGCVLWFEAAMLLAAVPRYQHEVQPGYGYAPMVIGGFGAGIVLACIAAALAARVPLRARAIVFGVASAAFALVLTTSFETNAHVLLAFQAERSALINLTAALEDGLASNVPDGATLLTDTPMLLFHRDYALRGNTDGLDNPKFFVREHTGHMLRVRGLWEDPPALPCDRASCATPDTYALHDVPLRVRDGYTVLGTVHQVRANPGGTLRTWADGLRVHLRGDALARAVARDGLTMVYTCAADGSTRTTAVAVAAGAIRNGTTVAVPAACLVDLDSVALARARG